MRVLIVEDEQVSRRALGLLLRSQGYRVATAESGEAALEILQQHDCPDVVLLDVDLPGISGLELLKIIEVTAPHVIPVLVTAADSDKVRPATGRGVEYLRKPININHLFHVIDRFGSVGRSSNSC